MYPIENQVSTYKQSKILKEEFGLKLDTYFGWTVGENQAPKLYKRKNLFIANSDLNLPAPSCAESGVLLPFSIKEGEEYWLNKGCINDAFKEFWNGYDTVYLSSEHEAHAKTDLLIQCLREGYIKPEDLKLGE